MGACVLKRSLSASEIRLQSFHYLCCFCFIGNMDVKLDRLGNIKAEYAHDRFGVDHVAARDKVKIAVKAGNLINKSLYFIDGIDQNLCVLHFDQMLLSLFSKSDIILEHMEK